MAHRQHFIPVLLALTAALGSNGLVAATDATEIRDLAARADALMRLGVAEKGATRSFEQAAILLDEAEGNDRVLGTQDRGRP